MDNDNGTIIGCYGISQDPITKNYVIVMQYVPDGNLKHYLDKNSHKNLQFRILQLHYIKDGLNTVHENGLTHQDFHPGNILNYDDPNNIIWCQVADLGLCRPADEKDGGKRYGVLPYVAPEVLRGEPYTQASDIYSFGIIAYEVLTGLPPYTTYDSKEKCYKELPHDTDLALKICQGLRPQFQIKVPPLLENLIKHCWDADPMKRPASLEELSLGAWWGEIRDRKDTEFYRQYKEIEKHNQNLPEEIKFPKYKSHKGAVYTSRLLPTGEIASLLQLQEISSELKETVRGYVKAKNKLLKDQKDTQAKKSVRELEEKLEEELKKRGFATEKMDEIIRYCENYHLLELEQQKSSVQGSQDQQTTNQSSTLVVELEQSSEEEIKPSFRQAEVKAEQPADNHTNPQQSEISTAIEQ